MISNKPIAEVIEESFRRLVVKDGFRKLTVAQICADANISRNTFYAHFDSKHNVLESCFYKDAAASTQQMFPLFHEEEYSFTPMLFAVRMYESIYQNRELYMHVLADNGEDELTSVIVRTCTLLHSVLSGKSEQDADDETRYARIFGAGAQSAILVQWIKEGMRIPPRQLASWTADWGFRSARIGFEGIDLARVDAAHAQAAR